MSLSSYFEQARKNASNHVNILRDFRYFLSSIGIVKSSIVLEDDLVLCNVKEEAVKEIPEKIKPKLESKKKENLKKEKK